MGRPSVHDADSSFAGRLCLRRVYLDSGGYDTNGTYFGHDRPLYWYASDDGEVDAMLRANTRAEARDKVLAKYPNAKVRR